MNTTTLAQKAHSVCQETVLITDKQLVYISFVGAAFSSP